MARADRPRTSSREHAIRAPRSRRSPTSCTAEHCSPTTRQEPNTMNEIVTEHSEGVLRIELNRPAKRNAMTASMYVTLADVFIDAARDENTRAALWHGAGDSFCAGNDIEDFLNNPPGAGDSPQARLMNALVDFDKPIVAAVHGAAIGGGTPMLRHW